MCTILGLHHLGQRSMNEVSMSTKGRQDCLAQGFVLYYRAGSHWRYFVSELLEAPTPCEIVNYLGTNE